MDLSSNRYQIWPFFKDDDGVFNLPDAFLRMIWDELEATGRILETFSAGDVSTLEQWMAFTKREDNNFVFVMDSRSGQPVFMSWVNGIAIRSRSAFAHFCGIGPYRRGSLDLALDYWTGVRGLDGRYMLDTLVGLTPSTNEKALKLMRMVGCVIACEIPGLCYMAATGELVAGTISYFKRKGA